MSLLKKFLRFIFPKTEISSDFSEKELEILKKVGVHVFTQDEIKGMKKINLEMRKQEMLEKANAGLLLTR